MDMGRMRQLRESLFAEYTQMLHARNFASQCWAWGFPLGFLCVNVLKTTLYIEYVDHVAM
jgi:hypothetical protein